MADQTTTQRRTPRVPHQTPMYEPGGTMSRTWIIFFERLGRWTEINQTEAEKKATFGLVKLLTVTDDLTLHFIARTSGPFIDLAVNGKEPCTGAPVRIKIEKWHEDLPETPGAWKTIFSPPGYIEIPVGNDDVMFWTREENDDAIRDEVFKEDGDGRILAGDMLRINCTQIGSTFAGKGYEFVLRWE